MLEKMSTKNLGLILGILVFLFIGIGFIFYFVANDKNGAVGNSVDDKTEKAKDSISSPVVGTLTVYYAKERLKIVDNNGETKRYEKGDMICDSRGVCSVKDINSKEYKVILEDDLGYDVTITFIMPKDKIEKKVYQMNQLPIALIGDRKTFKSADGKSAVIFKSNNNGHKYIRRFDGQIDVENTQKYANCYVINIDEEYGSGDYPLLLKRDYIDLYDDNNNIGKELFLAYNLSKEGSAYDSNGNMIDDKTTGNESGFEYDPFYLAYIGSLKALYINGKMYYEQ